MVTEEKGALLEQGQLCDAKPTEADEWLMPPSKFEPGSVWKLGRHWLAVLDSTKPESYVKLKELGAFDAHGADVVFADPPYMMGKQSSGVINDNIYDEEKAADFSQAWFANAVGAMSFKGSILVWGAGESLFLFYNFCKKIKEENKLRFRNLITWAKSSYPGDAKNNRCFLVSSEQCLFMMKGWTTFQKAADFFDGFAPLRDEMVAIVKAAGGVKECNKILGNQMTSHYVATSEWMLPTKKAYVSLFLAAAKRQDDKTRKMAEERFKRMAEERFKRMKEERFKRMKEERFKLLPYFDGKSERVSDVIRMAPISTACKAKECHGFPCSKPVKLCTTLLRAVTPPGGLVLDPFCGSGSTLIACEHLGRRCVTLELLPRNVAICVDRWMARTGGTPVRVA